MKKIFYVYRVAKKESIKKMEDGLEPDHFLYGFNHLKNMGIKVEFSDRAYSKWNFLKILLFPLEQLIIKTSSLGFKIDQAILLYTKLRKTDVILTTIDSAGLPILFLKYLKIIKSKVIFISVGLINELDCRQNTAIFNFYKKILPCADKIVCYSKVEKKLFIKLFPSLKKKIYFSPFGIDVKYFNTISKSKKTKKYILSVGRDRSRDYVFLAQVALKMSDLRFIVVTSRSNISAIEFPKNVELYYDLPYVKVKKLLSECELVFLPLKEILRASGQIAFLEAVAMRKRIVVADVKGIREVYQDLIKINKGVYLYKHEDIGSAVNLIRNALSDTEIKTIYLDKYTSEKYSQKLYEIIKNV